jgi:hypothetical protein
MGFPGKMTEILAFSTESNFEMRIADKKSLTLFGKRQRF